MNEQSRGIGDNIGVMPSAGILREYLADTNTKLIGRRDELIAASARIPDAIEDEGTAQNVSDFIRQCSACTKAADVARVGAKEPYLEGGRAVDGFFKLISDPLDKVKRTIEARLTLYLRAKADRERREREERERLAREEEARRRREAEEAERKLKDERSLKDAIDARKRAEMAEADRIMAEKDAAAKASDLSRTRGEFGAVSSLRTTWTFSDIDRAALDLEALRPHLPVAGLEGAIRAFIKAGGRELVGCHIFQTTDAVVR